jgi:hypothetical protein
MWHWMVAHFLCSLPENTYNQFHKMVVKAYIKTLLAKKSEDKIQGNTSRKVMQY